MIPTAVKIRERKQLINVSVDCLECERNVDELCGCVWQKMLIEMKDERIQASAIYTGISA